VHGTGSQTILQKDQPKVLEHGDIVALLPDKLSYRIEYSNSDDKYELDVALLLMLCLCVVLLCSTVDLATGCMSIRLSVCPLHVGNAAKPNSRIM